MNGLKKNIKRSLAILLAVVLIISLGYFAAKDSRLHAEEEFDYYETEAPEEEDFDEPDEVEELIFDDEDFDEDSEEYEEDEESAEEFEEAEEVEEPAEESEEPEEAAEQSEEPEESEEDKEAEEESKEEAEEPEEQAEDEAKEEPKDESVEESAEEPVFDPAQAYADYQNMSMEELNAYLAGLSEEELAALEKYAESLDEEDSGEVKSDNTEKTFTVVFKDWDGAEIATQTVNDGGNAVPPVSPEREGYVFSKWDKALDNIKEDTEFTAEYMTAEEAETAKQTEEAEQFNFAEAYESYIALDEEGKTEFLASLDEAQRKAFELYIGERQAAEAKAAEDKKEEPAAEKKVRIWSDRASSMNVGQTVRLYSELTGFDGIEVQYQWLCNKGNGYEPVPGANSSTYEFEATQESLSWSWRLSVDF